MDKENEKQKTKKLLKKLNKQKYIKMYDFKIKYVKLKN